MNIDEMGAEKLHDTLTTNETKFPEIFDLSEKEVIKIMKAAMGYVQLNSYQDWLKMYNGIHHESTFESAIKHWLACVRWMKQQK